ncbi:MAG: VWA domain-containing protein, partial [Chloroflexi bacterium]
MASQSPLNRRAVILLSDGADYGGVSRSEREDALRRATVNGVPVYTIGLGYGTDRTYLQELSRGTNAIFTESPSSDQLVSIYTQLANRFRSQYVLSVTTGDLAFDGTEYGFGVSATINDMQTNVAEGVLRMPIPVPIVEFNEGQFADPIAEPHIVNVTVRSDDPVTGVTFSIDGEVVSTSYGFAIEPVLLQPGTHTLEVAVTDANGDTGSAAVDFEVAALPTEITLVVPEGEVSEPFTVSVVQGTTQTEGLVAVYSLDGEVVGESTTAPDFALTVDPFPLPAGEHTLSVAFTNAGGATTVVEAPFTLGNMPPRVELGIEEGLTISEPTDITVDA